MNILDDDVLGALGDLQALALDNTLAADADDALVATDGQLRLGGLVVLDINSVLVGVALVLADGVLATVGGVAAGLHAAALLGDGALAALVVECLVDEDNARGAVGQPGLESFLVR